MYFQFDSSPLRRKKNSILPSMGSELMISVWANPKGDEIIAIVSKEEIDAFVAAPKKGSSKSLIVAYYPLPKMS